MPMLTETLHAEGAAVDLSVGVSLPREEVLLRNRLAVPARQNVRAIIDTGSSRTFFAPFVIKALCIPPLDILEYRTTSSRATEFARTFSVSLTLLHVSGTLHFPAIEVVESAEACFAGESEEHGVINGLLDCDFLQHCIFTYDGKNGTFTLVFDDLDTP